MRTLVRFVFPFLLSLAAIAAARAEPFFARQDVLTGGTEGYHTFRIPGLVATPGGALLLFTDGRVNSRGDIGKMDLILKRSPDGGRSWEKVRTLFTAPGVKTKIGNVSAVFDRQTGEVHVVFCQDLKQAYCLTSKDEGVTFEPPLEITGAFQKLDQPWAFFATGHAHGLQLTSGRLLVPIFLSNTPRVGAGALKDFHVGLIYSEDHGRHWLPGHTVPEASEMNENTIYEAADGSIVMNARTTSAARQSAQSHDGGLTWSPPSASILRGARCQASTLVTQDAAGKRVLLFSNPASPHRAQLTVRLSYDDGQTWPYAKEVCAGPAAYGDLAQGPDGLIYLAHEAGDERAADKIVLATFNVEWLLSQPQAAPPTPAAEKSSAAPAPGVPPAK